ncbi:ABC transporter ATP-binding protein [Candidatus Saccharibacteria bacterium]|nr:ABC transporter ATP-binding protein [Candidatus Saccharibacteria bacterium]
MSKINLTNISKQYKLKRKVVDALNDISLEINSGSFTVLTGPSGSGKSTILQLVSGIEQPTSGQVTVDDQDLTKLNAQKLAIFRRKNVGIVFQQFYLDSTLTLRQNMELPAMFLGLSVEEREQRTKELATLMGLADHLDHLPSELSGGQIQRAAVARAIYNKPSILIADEPTSNLDQDNFLAVAKLFQQVHKTYGTTIIIATHDPRILEYASQTIKIRDGRVEL